MASNPNFTFQGRYKAQTDRVSGVSVDIVGKHGELIAAEPCQKITQAGRPSEIARPPLAGRDPRVRGRGDH